VLRPDVVIMDIRMPLLDGIEATRRLVGPDAPGGLRVLVVTTFNLDKYVFEAIRAGASGFLLKDTPAEAMIEGVRAVAAGHTLLAPEVTRSLIGKFGERIREGDGRAAAEVLAGLTEREIDVLRLIAAGHSNPEIAAALFISRETVKTYVSRILAKLGLRDRVHAVLLAYRIGLVTDQP
jgi:DNA-binding NarL/FixJ family response regulator